MVETDGEIFMVHSNLGNQQFFSFSQSTNWSSDGSTLSDLSRAIYETVGNDGRQWGIVVWPARTSHSRFPAAPAGDGIEKLRSEPARVSLMASPAEFAVEAPEEKTNADAQKEDPPKFFGERGRDIKAARKNLGWSTWKLAKRAGLHSRDVQAAEEGSGNVSVHVFMQIKEVLAAESVL
ncbi:MAG: hypothetical protein IT342_14675 [Candidatus Melainabacteria bacterium]|nr:hypothetical protein [Candidatus Melainabacteria bacterium]